MLGYEVAWLVRTWTFVYMTSDLSQYELKNREAGEVHMIVSQKWELGDFVEDRLSYKPIAPFSGAAVLH